MKIMIVDVGSNTVKYDLYFVNEEGFAPLSRRAEPVKLLGRIEDGVLCRQGFETLCGVLSSFAQTAKEEGAVLRAFATASLRALKSPQEVLARLYEETGVEVRLLSGKEEAACSFRGMQMTVKEPKAGMMLDMGGGSTELHFFENGKTLFSVSCPFGALSLKNACAAGALLSVEERAALQKAVLAALPPEAAAYPRCGARAVIVGGTAKACFRLYRALSGDPGGKKSMTRADFSFLADCFLRESLLSGKALESAKTLVPERYELMASGTAAFDTIFTFAGTKTILLCPGGVREGFLSYSEGRFLKKLKKPFEDDRRER